MPPTSVYFVWPRRIASVAAALMARVEDGASVFSRSASTSVSLSGPVRAGSARWELLAQPLLDDGRHHAGHRGAEAGHFLDEARRDVRVPLVRHEEHRLHGGAQLAVHEGHGELVLEVGHGPDAAH